MELKADFIKHSMGTGPRGARRVRAGPGGVLHHGPLRPLGVRQDTPSCAAWRAWSGRRRGALRLARRSGSTAPCGSSARPTGGTSGSSSRTRRSSPISTWPPTSPSGSASFRPASAPGAWRTLMELVGLQDMGRRRTMELSGRPVPARGPGAGPGTRSPGLLLLDEPFASLDRNGRRAAPRLPARDPGGKPHPHPPRHPRWQRGPLPRRPLPDDAGRLPQARPGAGPGGLRLQLKDVLPRRRPEGPLRRRLSSRRVDSRRPFHVHGAGRDKKNRAAGAALFVCCLVVREA